VFGFLGGAIYREPGSHLQERTLRVIRRLTHFYQVRARNYKSPSSRQFMSFYVIACRSITYYVSLNLFSTIIKKLGRAGTGQGTVKYPFQDLRRQLKNITKPITPRKRPNLTRTFPDINFMCMWSLGNSACA
jgi:hypothetical protein